MSDKSYIWDDAVRAKYINTLLLKKYAGIPNTRPEADFSSEPAIPTRTKVFSYQILKEKIPREAPNPQSLNEDTGFREKFKTYGGVQPKRFTGPSPYTYIVKYENLPLTHIFSGISYRGPRKTDPLTGTATDISENYLENIIPENFDISNSVSSYKITLTDKNGNPVTNNDETTWIIDPDAGILSYYAKTRFPFDSTNANNYADNPRLTFWRYEGKIGFEEETDSALTAAPPKIDSITFQCTSYYIRFSWGYPIVTFSDVIGKYLPSITTLNIIIKNADNTTVINTSITNTQYIKINQSDVPLTTFTIKLPDRNYPANADVPSTDLSGTDNIISIYYSNSSKSAPEQQLIFPGYADGNPPDVPTINSISDTSETALTITGTSGLPDSTDLPDTIVSFDVSYNAVENLWRNNGLIGHSGLATATGYDIISSGIQFNIVQGSLYPDTKYDIQIAAKNGGSGILSAYTGISSQTTKNLPLPRNMATLNMPTGDFYYFADNTNNNIWKVDGNQITLYSVFSKTRIGTNTISIATDYSGACIHTVETRGSNAENLMKLTASLTGKTDVVITYGGFGKPATADITTGNIRLSTTNLVDGYSETAIQNEGFYRYPILSVSLAPTAFTASSSLQIFTLARESKINTSAADFTEATTESKTLQFYVDETALRPNISTLTLSMTDSTTTGDKIYISGVHVLNTRSETYFNSSTALYANVAVDNIGKYFFRKPWLTFKDGSYTSSKDIDNIPTLSNGAIPISYSQNNIPLKLKGETSRFYKSISVEATAYNCHYPNSDNDNNDGISDAITATINIIGDCFPDGYIYNLASTSLTTSSSIGAHIQLQDTTTSPVSPANYDHQTSIIGINGPLQICSQRFRTYGNVGTGQNQIGYLNYSTLNGGVLSNSVNYSTLTIGKRWIAYAWKIISAKNEIVIRLNNFGGNDSTTLINQIQDRNNTNIELYYGYHSSGSNFPTTVWVDGISPSTETTPTISPTILNNLSTGHRNLRGYMNSTLINGNLNITVTGKQIDESSDTVYFICVIGLNTERDIEFSHISASFNAN